MPLEPLKRLSDLDPMPFGKYKGALMQDVPASYLHWLYTNSVNKYCPVFNYCKDNLNHLKKEYEDGIWVSKFK